MATVSRKSAIVPIALTVLLVIVGGFILSRKGQLADLQNALKSSDPLFLLVAAAAEVGFFIAGAAMFAGAVGLAGAKPPRFRSLVTLFVSIPFVNLFLPSGGLSGLIHEARQFRNMGVERSRALLATVMEHLLFTGSFLTIFAVGLLYLINARALTLVHFILIGIGLSLFGLLFAAAGLMFAKPDRVRSFAVPFARVQNAWRALLGKEPNPTHLGSQGPTFAEELEQAVRVSRSSTVRLAPAVLFALLMWSADIAALWAVFHAIGYNIHLGVLVSGYALAMFLGRLFPITPGGLAVVETSMAAAFGGLYVPVAIAVPAILIYRFLSLWLPALVGSFAYHALPDSPPVPATKPEIAA
ncbi:MAG: lysylphosphatidylglycerol synthase transmembrane domain-containing protein [Thermoplasmatota archaeon]